MTPGTAVAVSPKCIDGEVTDVEEWPAVNPWIPALLLYTTPMTVITTVAAALIAVR